jgi:hypothetical protein
MTRFGVMDCSGVRHDCVASNRRDVERWTNLVSDGWGIKDFGRSSSALRIIAGRVLDDGGDVASIEAFGRCCAADGHSLETTTAWFRTLLPACSRRARERLDRRDVALILANGWLAATIGSNHDRRASTTTVDVLLFRLTQHYTTCASLGLEASATGALVVFDAEPMDLSTTARTHVLDHVALQAEMRFDRGETLARVESGRLIVLAERSPRLAIEVREIVEAGDSWARPHLMRVVGWIESLASDPIHTAEHLASILG